MKRVIWLSALLISIGLVGGVFFFEFYVRVTDQRLVHQGFDQEQKLIYRPAVFARHVLAPRKMQAKGSDQITYPINRHGYRGTDFPLVKSPDSIRVLVYGGSAVFDQNVSGANDWPNVTGQLVSARGLEHIEVLNFGIPGHTSLDSVGRLLTEGHVFNPDYVVLYNGWNDIKYFQFSKPLLRVSTPYNRRDDPAVTLYGPVDRKLAKYSQTYMYLRTACISWCFGRGPEGKKSTGPLRSDFGELGPEQFRINVSTFIELARIVGATPILMTQATLVQSDNKIADKARISNEYAGLKHETLAEAFLVVNDIIRRVAAEKGALLIDVDKTMTGHPEYFSDHVHLSVEGSSALASEVSDRLVEILSQQATDRK